ncbi:11076_t:CDS:2, partial [Dentiscutata erythropus]
MENREQLMLLVEKVIGMVAEVIKCLKVVQEHDVDIPKSKRKDLRFVKTIDVADKKYLKVEFECDVGQFVVRRKSMEKKIEKGVLCDEFCCQNRFGHYWKSAEKTNSGGFREKKKVYINVMNDRKLGRYEKTGIR